MDYQGNQQQYEQYGYDPRSNGLSRRLTDDAQSSSNSLAQQNRADYPPRSLTDPEQQQNPQMPKPKRNGKICGKCGEGLTGQFVRALGDTYHLECFTCHVSSHFSTGSCRLRDGRGNFIVRNGCACNRALWQALSRCGAHTSC